MDLQRKKKEEQDFLFVKPHHMRASAGGLSLPIVSPLPEEFMMLAGVYRCLQSIEGEEIEKSGFLGSVATAKEKMDG